MTDTPGSAEVERQARALLDDRVASVRKLAELRQRRVDQEEATAQAKRDEHAGWKAALAGGWSEDELKKLGFAEPENPRRAPARRRRDHGDGPAGGGGAGGGA